MVSKHVLTVTCSRVEANLALYGKSLISLLLHKYIVFHCYLPSYYFGFLFLGYLVIVIVRVRKEVMSKVVRNNPFKTRYGDLLIGHRCFKIINVQPSFPVRQNYAQTYAWGMRNDVILIISFNFFILKLNNWPSIMQVVGINFTIILTVFVNNLSKL